MQNVYCTAILLIISLITNAQENTRALKDLPGKIHLIIFADTLSANIQSGCTKDKKNISDWVKKTAKYTKMELNIYNKEGYYSTTLLDSILKTLTVGPKDVVVFYYTGHGFRFKDQICDYPYLAFYNDTSYNKKNLQDIHTVLKEKNARLTITLGDLCNTSINVDIPTMAVLAVDNKKAYTQLFSLTHGDIIATSSKPRQISTVSSTKGSMFTLMLLESFNLLTQQPETPTWNAIFSRTQSRTIANSKKLLTPATQEPVYQIATIKY